MLVGILGFGMISGLLSAAMVLGGIGSYALAFLAYAVFGSLGAILYAVAASRRQQIGDDAEEETA